MERNKIESMILEGEEIVYTFKPNRKKYVTKFILAGCLQLYHLSCFYFFQ